MATTQCGNLTRYEKREKLKPLVGQRVLLTYLAGYWHNVQWRHTGITHQGKNGTVVFQWEAVVEVTGLPQVYQPTFSDDELNLLFSNAEIKPHPTPKA
jgi:hypothetical protein